MTAILNMLSILFINYILCDLVKQKCFYTSFLFVPGCQTCMCKRGIKELSCSFPFILAISKMILNACSYVFVKVPRPGGSKVAVASAVFESSCHLFKKALNTNYLSHLADSTKKSDPRFRLRGGCLNHNTTIQCGIEWLR